MSARDVLAASLWLIDREIAGAPLPHPAWETFRENDPETAMIYETQAGCHLAALTAAGYAVVPREPTQQMLDAWESVTDWQENTKDGARYALLSAANNARGEPFYRAMLAAGEATP